MKASPRYKLRATEKDISGSYISQVAFTPGDPKQLVLAHFPVKKSGYVYIYFSNESNSDVRFDNFSLSHLRGPLLEETGYYPFGLTMSGISSKALNGAPENIYKWNKGSELQNKEFSDGSGLELYATNFRSLDPQLGRWWQIDPKPDYSQSLYSSMNNNPILFNDPLGDTILIQANRKTTLMYNNGVLTNQDGTAYKGKVKGFLKQAVKALDNTRTGGKAGDQLIGDLEKGARFTISKTSGDNQTHINGTGIEWNPSDNQPQRPNADGTTGRPAWAGLSHELGHQWDLQQNGGTNVSTPWYTASDGSVITSSDKIATWWENRVRSENNIGLREFYSYMDPGNGGTWTPDPLGGRIINAGTRTSTIVDASGNIYPGSTLPAGVTPFVY